MSAIGSPCSPAINRCRRSQSVDGLGIRPIELLIATSSSGNPRANPFSSKLKLPGRRWQIERTESARDYSIAREIEVSRVSAPGESAVVYSWTIRSEGFWRETARSLFALERGPFVRSEPRVFIHLATRVGQEPDAEINAQRILNRFLSDFRGAFRSL